MNRIGVRWNVREQCAQLVVDGRGLAENVDPEGGWGVSPFARRFLRRPLKERWRPTARTSAGVMTG